MFKTHSASFKAVALTVAMVILAGPILTETANAKECFWAKGYAAGERDSKASWAWFLSGFVLSGLGVLIAYSVEPSPPSSSSFVVNRRTQLKQSQEYVQAYLVGYKYRGAREQGKQAWLGFVTGLGVLLAYIINVRASAK